MMDPVTAFGLAGTVATFIDFGTKFTKLTWSIYHDEGSSNPASELSKLAKQFERTVIDIRLPACDQADASEDNLNQLANECKDFSAKIVMRLGKAGLLDQRPNSKKAAFISAIRLSFRRGDLDKLKNELEGLRDRFSFLLLVSLRSLAQQNLEAQDEIVRALKLSDRKNHDFQNGMQLIMSDLALKLGEHTLEGSVIRLMAHDRDVVQTPRACEIVLSKKDRERSEMIVTDLIEYRGMHERQEQVTLSFETTFDWALEEIPSPDRKWTHLPTWLASNDQVYWISGKAGSGKSTFMKYLSQHPSNQHSPRCYPFLHRWAKQRDLVIASFYFWASDSGRMQKSREGLFRTLLYQIFTAKPTLIPHVFPKEWEILALTGPKRVPQLGSESEFRAAIIRAIELLPAHNCCICLFIDGLDEFEGQPSILIDLVQAIARQGEHVKLCLASRPWVEFGDAFKQKPQLLLEDLTYNDIKLFVTRKFDNHPEFNNLKVCEPDFANQLVENIVSKGQGVFLWVALVVGSLLSGISFGDRVKDLQRRLDMLPLDLESLYERLIDGLDPFYHEHRAQLIMIVEAAQEALPVVVLYYADGGTIETLKPLSSEYATTDTRIQQINTMRRRLNSRWRGLIEFTSRAISNTNDGGSSDLSSRVRYLHKTVSDFVKGPKMRAFIQQHTKADFDPHFQLCIGYCAYRLSTSNFPDDQEYFFLCLEYAREAKRQNEAGVKQAVDYLCSKPDNEQGRDKGHRDMLEIAAYEGVTAYVLPTLNEIPYSVSELNDLLERTLNSRIFSAEIVRALLTRIPCESSYRSSCIDSVLERLKVIRNPGAQDQGLYKELEATKANRKRYNENVFLTDRPRKRRSNRLRDRRI